MQAVTAAGGFRDTAHRDSAIVMRIDGSAKEWWGQITFDCP